MRLILFFLLLFQGISAYAQEPEPYEWYIDGYEQYRGATPDIACSAMATDRASQPPSSGWSFPGTYTLTRINDIQFRCSVDVEHNQGGTAKNDYIVKRSGNTCPNPETQTYNPETGECESDNECEAKEGQETPLYKSGKGPDAFVTWRSSDGMFFVTETAGCNEQCKVDLLDTRCKGNTEGNYWCWMTGRYTGEKCGPGGGEGGGGNPPELSHPDSQWSEPTKTEDTKPCIYVVNSDGSKSCTSEHTVESDGHSCGVANGVVVCSPPSKPPTKEDLKVNTTITEQTNPDGSTTTTKTDQADYVTCVGTRCSSSTTTSTTTTTKDGNGNTTGSSSTCTGPLCGDKNGAPGADGEGIGDCIINCGDGEGEGEGSDFDGGEFGEVKEFGESVDDFMERAGNAPIIQAISGIAFPSGGSCGFGAASTKIGTISLDGMCDNSHWLDPLYPIFLAAWCFAAVRKFMEA